MSILNTALNPLGKIREIADAINLEISYAYDDLVFIEGNPFLIRFDQEKVSQVYLHFNKDCEQKAEEKLKQSITMLGREKGLLVLTGKKYEMKPNETNNEIEIHFIL